MFATFSIAAQSDNIAIESDTTTVIQVQTAHLELEKADLRIPPVSKIEKYKEDKRFQYDTKIVKSGWWDRVKAWLAHTLWRLTAGVFDSGVLGFFGILALVAIIVFIVLKLSGIKFKRIFGKNKIDTPEINIYTENVHEMDFDTLIQNAIKNNDYRLAIRFMYLKNLKTLSDKSLITWNINKTNYSYQHEITNATLRDKFLETTFIFDYVWYGEFPLDQAKFARTYSELEIFNNMVTNER